MDQRRQVIVSEAHQHAEIEAKKILDDAEVSMKQRQDRVEQSLARERQEMLKQVSTEAVNHAVELAERLLRQSADRTLQTQLAKHLIEALTATSEDQRERLRQEWRAENQARLETATSLEAEVSSRIREAVNSLAGKALVVNIQIDPALIAGVRLRIGGHLWDASIAGQVAGDLSKPAEISTNV